MKSALLYFITCVAASLAATPIFAKVWPMYFKSGSSLTVEVRYFINSGPASIEIYYPKATKAAGNKFENLKAGECSWPDRTIRSDERSSAVFSYGVLLGARAPFVVIRPGNEDSPTTWSLSDSTLNDIRSKAGKKFKMFVEMQNGELHIESNDGSPHIEWVN